MPLKEAFSLIDARPDVKTEPTHPRELLPERPLEPYPAWVMPMILGQIGHAGLQQRLSGQSKPILPDFFDYLDQTKPAAGELIAAKFDRVNRQIAYRLRTLVPNTYYLPELGIGPSIQQELVLRQLIGEAQTDTDSPLWMYGGLLSGQAHLNHPDSAVILSALKGYIQVRQDLDSHHSSLALHFSRRAKADIFGWQLPGQNDTRRLGPLKTLYNNGSSPHSFHGNISDLDPRLTHHLQKLGHEILKPPGESSIRAVIIEIKVNSHILNSRSFLNCPVSPGHLQDLASTVLALGYNLECLFNHASQTTRNGLPVRSKYQREQPQVASLSGIKNLLGNLMPILVKIDFPLLEQIDPSLTPTDPINLTRLKSLKPRYQLQPISPRSLLASIKKLHHEAINKRLDQAQTMLGGLNSQ